MEDSPVEHGNGLGVGHSGVERHDLAGSEDPRSFRHVSEDNSQVSTPRNLVTGAQWCHETNHAHIRKKLPLSQALEDG